MRVGDTSKKGFDRPTLTEQYKLRAKRTGMRVGDASKKGLYQLVVHVTQIAARLVAVHVLRPVTGPDEDVSAAT